MTWALKRQILYIGILLLFLGLILLYFLWPYLNRPPTCTDGKQNGIETGIDCGGDCPIACTAEVDKLSVFWARSFEVVPGRYNAIAYVENQNENQVIQKIKYRFRFADENNLYIGQREGETFVPPAGKFAIFEGAISLGNSVPVFTTFEFTSTPVWVNVDKSLVDQLKLNISNMVFESQNNIPRLSAEIRNTSLFNIPDLRAVAVLYDEFGNVLNVSSTVLPMLYGESSDNVSFTWRSEMSKPVASSEIIPLFNIFNVKLK